MNKNINHRKRKQTKNKLTGLHTVMIEHNVRSMSDHKWALRKWPKNFKSSAQPQVKF